MATITPMKRYCVVAVHVVAAAESIQGAIIGAAEQGVLGSGRLSLYLSAHAGSILRSIPNLLGSVLGTYHSPP